MSAGCVAGLTLNVKVALPPSATAAPAATFTVGSDGSSSSMIEKLAVPEPVAAPSAVFAASVPKATVTVSSVSSTALLEALTVTMAARETAAPPVKVMVGGLSVRFVLLRLL